MEMTIDPGYEKPDEFHSLTNSDVGYEETKMTLRDDLIGWSNSTDSEIDGKHVHITQYFGPKTNFKKSLNISPYQSNVLLFQGRARRVKTTGPCFW